MTDIVERLRSAALPGTNRNVIDCAAADEIERLRAELAQAMKERSRAIAVGDDLEQEVERLRLDAARYRWLREQAHWEDERDMAPGGRWWLAVMVNRGKPTFDSAIDAAMKG